MAKLSWQPDENVRADDLKKILKSYFTFSVYFSGGRYSFVLPIASLLTSIRNQ